MDLGWEGSSPEDNWDLLQQRKGKGWTGSITDDSPTPPFTFAILFSWSELNVEIQVTHCFLGQEPGDAVSLYSSSWTQCSELPPAHQHGETLNVDPPPHCRRFLLVVLLPLFGKKRCCYVLCSGLELRPIKASGGKTKETRTAFVSIPVPALLTTSEPSFVRLPTEERKQEKDPRERRAGADAFIDK